MRPRSFSASCLSLSVFLISPFCLSLGLQSFVSSSVFSAVQMTHQLSKYVPLTIPLDGSVTPNNLLEQIFELQSLESSVQSQYARAKSSSFAISYKIEICVRFVSWAYYTREYSHNIFVFCPTSSFQIKFKFINLNGNLPAKHKYVIYIYILYACTIISKKVFPHEIINPKY